MAGTDLKQSTLCLACRSIFNADTVKNDLGEVVHHGLEALAARASRSCHLCLTVYMSIDPEAYKNFRKGVATDSLGYAWISPIARDQARLKFRYVKSDSARSTPTSKNSSKTSLSSAPSDVSLGVELILMDPKCECPETGPEP